MGTSQRHPQQAALKGPANGHHQCLMDAGGDEEALMLPLAPHSPALGPGGFGGHPWGGIQILILASSPPRWVLLMVATKGYADGHHQWTSLLGIANGHC